MKKFNILLNRAQQRLQKLKNQSLINKEIQNSTINKQLKFQEALPQKQYSETNQNTCQLDQTNSKIRQYKQANSSIKQQKQTNQKLAQQKQTNQNPRRLKQYGNKIQDSQKLNNKSISGEFALQKLQQKLYLKKVNVLKTFQLKIEHNKQQSCQQRQQKQPIKRQVTSIKTPKKQQKKTRTQSFAQYTFSQNQIKCLKQIQYKEQFLNKFFDYQNSKIKKAQSSEITIKEKYKCKFFHSGSNINQNTSQLAFIKKWVYGIGKTPQKFLISSWNLNGLKKSVQKRFMFGYLKLSNPDIFCIQQLKMDYQTYKQNPINLEGYNSYWNFCKCSKGYSGVAVFSKFAPIRVIQDFPQSPQFSQQGRILTLQFQSFFLVNTYFPASGQRMQRLNYKVFQYQPIFRKFVMELSSIKQVIIAGDMNVARTELDAYIYTGVEERQAYHPMERNRFQHFLKQGWIDTFRHFHPKERKFTWWNIQLTGRKKNMGKRIDYYLVRHTFLKYLQDSDVMNHIWGSDHCPIELKVNFILNQNSKNEYSNKKDAYLKDQNKTI